MKEMYRIRYRNRTANGFWTEDREAELGPVAFEEAKALAKTGEIVILFAESICTDKKDQSDVYRELIRTIRHKWDVRQDVATALATGYMSLANNGSGAEKMDGVIYGLQIAGALGADEADQARMLLGIVNRTSAAHYNGHSDRAIQEIAAYFFNKVKAK